MRSPAWWSQPFAPEGSVAAEGIANQLGRPALDPLEILVREAAQNSWDARRPDGFVRFSIDIRHVGETSSTLMRRMLPGPAPDSVAELSDALAPDSILMVISDRGTVGLGGPSRAGAVADPEERSDFVQFIRNVGEPRDTPLGGGTYGFGKGIFYRLSRPGVILVDSKFGAQAEERRLMGAATGNSFARNGQRFTGRHWWGAIADDDVPDPLIGADAAAVASDFGLPGFEDDDTGTDIVVIGADLGLCADGSPRSARDAGEYLVSSILWHLWPKMVSATGPRMEFAVTVDDEPIDVPHPSTVRGLEVFVEALEQVRSGEGSAFARAAEPKLVGQLGIAVGPASTDSDVALVDSARPIEPPFHHVARMRQAELVVDYFDGPIHPNPSLEYAGVFQASAEADPYFVMAEPPTHDAWIERGLSGTARGVVIGTKSFIRKSLDERFGQSVGGGIGEKVGLAAFANRLGSLLVTESEVDIKIDERSPGTSAGAGPRSASVKILEPTRLIANDDQPFLVCRARMTAGAQGARFFAEALVKLDGGGKESSAPIDSAVPRILQWAAVEDGAIVSGDRLELPAGEISDWWVYASFVPETVVEIAVRRIS